MFIRIKQKPNGKKAIQIVEAIRKADKVQQKIVRHIGQAETDREVEALRNLARAIIFEIKEQRQPSLPLFNHETLLKSRLEKRPARDKVDVSNLREEQRIIEGIGDVFGRLYQDLGMTDLISGSRKDLQWNAILRACVLARIANPESKRRTASLLEQDYGIKIPLEKIYRMMNHVAANENSIKKHISSSTQSLFSEKVDVLFFDVTTLYFESFTPDGLREFGFSKDCKFKETQVVLALVTATNGLPITYKLFPGNMYEGHTLIQIIEDLKIEHKIENVLLVADRAMFTKTNLDEMERLNVNYIVAAKLKNLKKAVKDEILRDFYEPAVVNNEFHWVRELEHEGKRLVVSFSSKRAKKDGADRQRLIDRLMKKVKDGKINVSELITNHGTKKFIKVEKGAGAVVNEEKIKLDSLWDGLHGVITNVKDKSPAEILERYRGLWQIEEAFRVNKHDLRMRPIYHWTEERIRAHIAICFIAFTLAKQAVYRFGIQQHPMSFEQIRNELLHAQASIVKDISTGKKYVIPSQVTLNQEKLYQAFGLKRSAPPYALE
jgi:transposase